MKKKKTQLCFLPIIQNFLQECGSGWTLFIWWNLDNNINCIPSNVLVFFFIYFLRSFIYSLSPTLGDFYHYWPTEDKGKIEFGYITVTQTSTEQRVSYVKREFTVYNQKVDFSNTASLQLGPVCLFESLYKLNFIFIFDLTYLMLN